MADIINRIHCSYHKCLTGYFGRVMGGLYNKLLRWSPGYRHFDSDLKIFKKHIGEFKVMSVNNHMLDLDSLGDYRITRFVRDPRDMVISGYFYHKRGAEDWCNVVAPTGEQDKIRNEEILFLMGKTHSFSSYLQSLPEEAGLLVEIEFRKRHFESMLQWPVDDKQIRLFRYEDILGNEVEIFREIFDFYETPVLEKQIGLFFANHYSARRQQSKIKHIRNPNSQQWKQHFTPAVAQRFDHLFPSLLERFGYL